MAILKVAKMGHPVLRKTAESVRIDEIQTAGFQQFIEDMIETMREYDGIGLAAPQVHRAIRVSVIDLGTENRYGQKGESGVQVFINPVLKHLTDETNAFWEGCLSVPGLRGLVARPNKVQVKYHNGKGEQCEITAEGFFATVLQHEFDHLDGKLYVDRLVDSTKLVFEREFEKYWVPDAGDEAEED